MEESNDTFGLGALKGLIQEAEGLKATYDDLRGVTDDRIAGARPSRARAQTLTSPASDAKPAVDMNLGARKWLVPILAALVIGWITWKATGKPVAGFGAAAVAALLAWFLFVKGG